MNRRMTQTRRPNRNTRRVEPNVEMLWPYDSAIAGTLIGFFGAGMALPLLDALWTWFQR